MRKCVWYVWSSEPDFFLWIALESLLLSREKWTFVLSLFSFDCSKITWEWWALPDIFILRAQEKNENETSTTGFFFPNLLRFVRNRGLVLFPKSASLDLNIQLRNV